VRPDGTGLRRVLRTRQNAKRPTVSPDRRWIVFDGAAPGKAPLTDFDVMAVRADGSELRVLAATPEWELDADWSPDGRRVVYSRWSPEGEDDDWQHSHVYTVGRDGRRATDLGLGVSPRWSPAG